MRLKAREPASTSLRNIPLPANLEDPDATIEVKARLGTFVKEISEDIDFTDRSEILLSTDKPIYQPGQSLRVRVLAFDASRHALSGIPLDLTIHDPEFMTVFRTKLLTSQFGEAHSEWLVPENIRLGDYVVEVEGSAGSARSQQVKISRYDLPNFTVTSKSDRTYYLPNQNAEVEIRADYLFGQPVKQGRVRVVRETRRHWNYRDQKWETVEGNIVQGDLDIQGRFLAKLDLLEEHDRLAALDYERYVDLQYAAYVTDLTTNRTEQRRFDLRLSKEPIHVYISEAENAHGFPVEFYLSTFYADGSPAKCRVVIYESGSQFVRTINTNRYGVAKVGGLRSDSSVLFFTADDGKGGHAQHTELFWLKDSAIRVYPNKTVYRHGDALEVEVRSTYQTGPVILDVLREERVLQSRVLQLRNGKAFTVIPYAEEFKDDLTIAASFAGSSDEDRTYGMRRVAYPRNRELKIDTRLDQATYAPGQEASVGFRIRSAESLSRRSLLGVVVLDKAIEDRARTDQEFGSTYRFCDACFAWLGFGQELSGLSRRDLDRLDLSQPVPDEVEVAAEVLLNPGFRTQYVPRWSEEDDDTAQHVFHRSIDLRLEPLKKALDERFRNDREHPTGEGSLRKLLSISGLNLETFRDPWDNPYRLSFSVDRGLDLLSFRTAGPDKQFGSPDDFTVLELNWPYFKWFGETIDKVVRDYHQRTGGFIRDSSTLKSELVKAGQDFDSWRDRWGRAYRLDFGVVRTHFTVTVRSSGPNGTVESPDNLKSDDFSIWTSVIDYTSEVRDSLDQAVSRFYRETKTFPETETQFAEAVRLPGTPDSTLRDPWSHRYYPTFKTEHYYSDHVSIMPYADYLRTSTDRVSAVPVTRKIQFLVLRSAGPDGVEGTSDDFDVANISRVLAEQSARDVVPQADPTAPLLQGFRGAIQGFVADSTSARIPGVTVEAKASTGETLQTTTDASGAYLLRNLQPGLYEVSFHLPGFVRRIIGEVPVRSSATTDLSVTLYVGSAAQMVEVVAGNVATTVTLASLSVQVKQKDFSLKPVPQTSTPRLREYFPETLVWQPALETDRSGRAQLKFKLPDNITTWKMAAVVSTTDGEIGMVEKEIVAFQPFFLEHDPPRILTEGDEIAMPVIIRSYLDKDQSVELSVKPDDWFGVLNGTSRKTTIKAGETSRETFSFKAFTAIKDGKQRINAKGSHASDSIEKPVTVHPDGEEVTHVTTQIFRNESAATITVPPYAIPDTLRAEVKIYPNLMAHVVDGIEGILRRPYGCAEQTISSAYPGLMLLRYQKQSGRESPALAVKAKRYLQTGLDRLWAYQTAEGGFSYWGRGPADVAVTAYAVQFLHDAEEIVSLDENALVRAYQWLERQQHEDGSWRFSDASERDDQARTVSLTALVARVLSQPDLREAVRRGRPAVKGERDTLAGALAYLRKQSERFEEPYALASLALTAINAGDTDLANSVLARLQRAAHKERDGTYWDSQTNTPFYGWGFAGRIETTALAVRAFAAARNFEALTEQGLSFLLRSKDRYGVWHSTQATVNVLDALTTLIGREDQKAAVGGSAEIIVNGVAVSSLTIPADSRFADPILMDVSKFLTAGFNRVEVRGSAGPAATVQVLDSYYIPWNHTSDTDPKAQTDSTTALRLNVRFDTTQARAGDEIVCRVEAERIGFRGYGMMLAEIGLPPGAEVDRASLEEVIKSGSWALYRYDVLPDRLIAYLWPRAGGTQFHFKVRLRYGINAQTPASVLYDYYNPDAQIVVKPVRFEVR